MHKTASQIAFGILIKLAKTEEEIRYAVYMLAEKYKQYGVTPPTDKEFQQMFPKGWEQVNPSWQETLLKSPWMVNANNAKAGVSEAASSAAGGARAWGKGTNWDDVFRDINSSAWKARSRFIRNLGLIGLGLGTAGGIGLGAHTWNRHTKAKGIPDLRKEVGINFKQDPYKKRYEKQLAKNLAPYMSYASMAGGLGAMGLFDLLNSRLMLKGLRIGGLGTSLGSMMIGSSAGGMLGKAVGSPIEKPLTEKETAQRVWRKLEREKNREAA